MYLKIQHIFRYDKPFVLPCVVVTFQPENDLANQNRFGPREFHRLGCSGLKDQARVFYK